MRSPLPLRIAAAITALAQLSCASAGFTPAQHSQPVERIGLLPEYRIFYDALVDQGDWVYIQPAGYVFRPRVNFLIWRPYEDGFWAPSDIYGWTWISAEPFGWATYHYGTWSYDQYYGWVWEPGRDWAPAWVAWQATDDYVGWSPLLTPGSGGGNINGGAWSYAPLRSLGATDLSGRILHASDLGARVQGARKVENIAERGGVRFNRGPAFDMVEKATGPFQRVKLEAVAPPAAPATAADEAKPAASPAKAQERAALNAAAVESMRRDGADVARAAHDLAERSAPVPASLRMIHAPARPPGSKSAPAKPGAAAGADKGAPADTASR